MTLNNNSPTDNLIREKWDVDLDAAIKKSVVFATGNPFLRSEFGPVDMRLIIKEIDRMRDALREKDAEIARLREALDTIYVYSNDTISGRADGGPDDRAWQRETVLHVRDVAQSVLPKRGGRDADQQ